ncbi:thioredoxin-like negative regulator of GroEL [Halorubrum trapanicum]|uniref:Thioredoxin-like negative regulator of GroEL n=1 Tax=Halorubrum trapanicum TaxID=29284 RepID=A0A8J7R9T3_9EURY|nr:thioredoxin family protein [Halorubrum trapanicum]MBP1903306.1 thioredoxin-like negative regulator of GroEL [Halorubrum trapanicum]
MGSNTVPTDSGGSEAPAKGLSGADRPVSLADADALDEFVADAAVALVEFYTDGCGICASMEPVIGNVARGVEADLAVGTVNPRDDPPLIERFDVRSVPLFVLFVDGEPVARRAEGFIPGEDLAAWVDEHAA